MTIRGVDSVSTQTRCDVENAVIRERRALEGALFAQLEYAHLSEVLDVAGVDLVKLRVPISEIPLVRSEPIARIGIRRVQLCLRRSHAARAVRPCGKRGRRRV